MGWPAKRAEHAPQQQQPSIERRGAPRSAIPACPGVDSSRKRQLGPGRRPVDPNIVSFAPDDPENPKNWSFRTRWGATVIVSAFTFISPVSSSMIAPALPAISRDLGITTQFESVMLLSAFVLAYAFGPLLLGPLSELFGRTIVLQLANLFFLAWNVACGFATTKAQMIAFRFMAGLGGSAPLSVGGGVLSDLWRAEERGRAISIYSLAPLLGPAVAPIAGGFIAEHTSWRWAFWSTSIADALVQLLGLLFLKETYPPRLLAAKAARLRRETGNDKLRSEFDTRDRTFAAVLRTALVRPFRLLATQPIVQFLAVYMAYLYGIMYLVLATFPTLWSEVYHQSTGIGGLHYIALGAGFFAATQLCAPLNDRIYAALKARRGGVGAPEFRTPLMFVSAALVPVGLLWYGWAAERHAHWIVPDLGIAVFAAGVIIGFQCIQTYLVDSYTRYAASAIAAGTFLRSLAGFGFPLFAPYMYDALGYGGGNSMLAGIAVVFGAPLPWVLWKWGAAMRARSPFAAGG
ncbi:MFS multidrug transporter [Geopyxis carbonaria]|nr:MFS multidrug transporter [Geopyxis carbonaria]